MSLKLNLGLSRKVGEANYGSRGASINLEMEIESSLAAEPGKLQGRIRQLFDLVRVSLAEELNGHANGKHPPDPGAGSDPAHAEPSRNGHSHNDENGSPRMATSSQLKAISAIAHRQRINLMLFLQNRIGVGRPTDLTIRQASQVIDDLKAKTNGGGRRWECDCN